MKCFVFGLVILVSTFGIGSGYFFPFQSKIRTTRGSSKVHQNIIDADLIEAKQKVLSPTKEENENFKERAKKVWGKTKSGQELYRIYPYQDIGLPVLFDVNNYYSGTFGNIFWHQNADQVLIHIPLHEYDGDNLVRRDIDSVFDHEFIKLTIKDQTILSFKPIQKIKPDGCFWSFERSSNGVRYIQLDIEKKFQYSNWKGLFADIPDRELEDLDLRSQMLEKLYKLNQAVTDGSSKTIEEMLQDPQIMDLIVNELDEERKKVDQKKDKLSAALSSVEQQLSSEEERLVSSLDEALQKEEGIDIKPYLDV